VFGRYAAVEFAQVALHDAPGMLNLVRRAVTGLELFYRITDSEGLVLENSVVGRLSDY